MLHRAHPLEQLEPRLALAGLVVSNPSVNEASPYAVFVVKGTANEAVSLSLGGTATGGGVDYGPGLEWTTNGTTWTTYTSGTINLSAGDGEAFVRLPIVNDTPFDNGETIVLTVTPSVGSAASGVATLRDDGTGNTYDGTVGGAPLDASALSVEEWRRLSSEKSRLMMASFHGAFYKSATGGFYVAGELASPTGLNQTVPVLVTPANGYTITGDIIDIALAGNNGTSQYAVLTTDGLWAWGYEGTLLPDDLTPSRAISSIALPSDFDPRDAVSMSASVGGILFLMRDGTVRSVVTNTEGTSTPRASSHAAGDHFAKVRLGSVTGGILTGITDIEYGPNSAFVYSKNTNKFRDSPVNGTSAPVLRPMSYS